VQQVAELVGRLRQPRHDLLAGEAQHRAHVGRIVQRVDGEASQPLASSCSTSARACCSTRSVSTMSAPRRAERTPQPGQRAALAAPRLLRAQDAEHEVDAGVPAGGCPRSAARRG
jgi:hypothetical protein